MNVLSKISTKKYLQRIDYGNFVSIFRSIVIEIL